MNNSTSEVDDASKPAPRSGAWPVKPSFEKIESPIGDTSAAPVFERGDEAWLKLQAERAERHIILGRIRASLEAEPNGRAIRASARRWSGYISCLGETVATEREAEAS